MRSRQRWVGLAFVTPFVLVMLVFLVIPLGWALRMSLYRSTLVRGPVFAGIDNYTRALTDPVFLEGLLRVVLFGLVQTPVMIGLALVSALVLDAVTGRMMRAFRLIVFMPYAVPVVVGALMWGFLYSPTFGPLSLLGMSSVDLLGRTLILPALGNIVTWQWTGYNTIVIYAALQGIPRDVVEAARVDGAGAVRTALRIKVPLVSSAVVLTVVFSIIGMMQFFSEPLILRTIAGGAISATYTPNMYAHSLAFAYSDINYSAAISFALGAFVFLGSYAFLFLARRRSGLS
jgi:multiple sugar transport system permease protein